MKFELRISHLFTLKIEFFTTRLLNKKNDAGEKYIYKSYGTFYIFFIFLKSNITTKNAKPKAQKCMMNTFFFVLNWNWQDEIDML